MKRISSSKKSLIAFYAIKKRRKFLARKARKGHPYPSAYVIAGGIKYLDLVLPSDMDFDLHKETTLKFIKKFRDVALSKKDSPFRLNFNNLKTISPAASIVLLAEIHRCWNYRQEKVRSTAINRCKIAKNLERMGFYELLEARYKKVKRALSVEEKTKAYIKFATAIKDDGLLADKIKQAVLKECPASLTEESKKKISSGLLECMSNVSRHAYEEKYKAHIHYPYTDRRWWVSGYVDKEKREILIQFYDQGAGIPNTLLTRLGERIKHTLDTQANLIKKATKPGESRTKKSYRGKGLPQIVNVIETTKKGSLHIISHYGEYKIYNEHGKLEEKCIDNDLSLHGTLIQWKLTAEDNYDN